MRMMIVAILTLIISASSSEARPRSHVRHFATAGTIVAHPAGCPRTRFCGCGVARYIFGRIDGAMRPLWLAREWFRFPRAQPAPGMVAVRRHHVFAIKENLGGGRVLAYNPNSGRRLTREHVMSLTGYRVVDPHGRGL